MTVDVKRGSQRLALTAGVAVRARLVVVTTHPIQYQCPVWRGLAAVPELATHVLFGSDCSVRGHFDHGFGQRLKWTVPLLDGYSHEFLGHGPVNRLMVGPICGRQSLFSRLRTLNPTACLINGYSPPLYSHVVAACRSLGIPILLRAETTDADRDRSGVHRGVRDALLRVLYSRVSRFLAIGKNSRAHFLRLGVPPARISDALYCVDTDLFESQYQRRHEGVFRRELGIPEAAMLVLFSGKLIPKKDPQTLLAAVGQMAAIGGRPVHLVFLGDGPLRATLSDEAQRMAPGRVHFVGFRQQEAIGEVYTDADMLVLPSIFSETWGLVVNEAMQFGLPCIVSDRVGCAPDLVVSGVTGQVFAHGDVGSLTSCLRKTGAMVMEDPRGVHARCRQKVAAYSTAAAVKAITAAAAEESGLQP